VGGVDESSYLEQDVLPSLLRAGINLIAAEVHQVNSSSSDMSFDLELPALVQPVNQPPRATAGPDREVSVNTPVRLEATWNDDGLPAAATLRWEQLSGP